MKGLESESVWHDLFDHETFMTQFNDQQEEQNLYREYLSFKNWTTAKNDFFRMNIDDGDLCIARAISELFLLLVEVERLVGSFVDTDLVSKQKNKQTLLLLWFIIVVDIELHGNREIN